MKLVLAASLIALSACDGRLPFFVGAEDGVTVGAVLTETGGVAFATDGDELGVSVAELMFRDGPSGTLAAEDELAQLSVAPRADGGLDASFVVPSGELFLELRQTEFPVLRGDGDAGLYTIWIAEDGVVAAATVNGDGLAVAPAAVPDSAVEFRQPNDWEPFRE